MELLPRDLTEVLISFLDNRAKRMMRLANMQWFRLSKYNEYIVYFLTRKMLQQMADRLPKYAWPVHITLKKSLIPFSPATANEYAKLTNLESLDVDPPLHFQLQQFKNDEKSLKWWPPRSLFANLKKLSITDVKGFKQHLLKLTNLTSLSVSLEGFFGADYFDENDSKALLNMTNLRELVITVPDNATVEPLSLCPTNLTKLCLVCDVMGDKLLRKLDFSQYSQLKLLQAFSETELEVSNLPPTIERLDLGAASIVTDPSVINSCNNLTKIYVRADGGEKHYDSKLISTQILRQLKSVQISEYYANQDYLAHLSSVECLHATCDITSIVHLSSSLQSLWINTEEIDQIRQFKNLTNLHILSSNTNLIALNELTNLRRLVHYGSDAPLDLARLTNLESLRLNNYRQYDYLSLLVNLSYLSIPINKLDGKFIDSLTILTRLTHVELNEVNEFNGDVWQHMTQLTNLQSLQFESYTTSNIGDILILRGLTRLTQLSVPIDDSIENQFCEFTQLSNLQLLTVNVAKQNRFIVPKTLDYLRKKMPHLLHIEQRTIYLPE